MWKPTDVEAGKAVIAGEESERAPSGSTGVLAAARMRREIDATRETPIGGRGVTSNRTPARDRPGCSGWRRGPYCTDEAG